MRRWSQKTIPLTTWIYSQLEQEQVGVPLLVNGVNRSPDARSNNRINKMVEGPTETFSLTGRVLTVEEESTKGWNRIKAFVMLVMTTARGMNNRFYLKAETRLIPRREEI